MTVRHNAAAHRYEMVPSLMWGQFTIPAGYRTDLKGLIQSSYPMFWEVDR